MILISRFPAAAEPGDARSIFFGPPSMGFRLIPEQAASIEQISIDMEEVRGTDSRLSSKRWELRNRPLTMFSNRASSILESSGNFWTPTDRFAGT